MDFGGRGLDDSFSTHGRLNITHYSSPGHVCMGHLDIIYNALILFVVAEEIAEVPFTPGHEMVGKVSQHFVLNVPGLYPTALPA